MNKVFQINLAGFPFTIDENAFVVLLDYLDSLKAYFKHSEGRDEIIYDIESRIAELFQENLNTKSIIDMRDVNAAIERMGTTEDFQDESVEDESGSSSKAKSYKTGRRLFRDEERGEVAGICAGLAAYFGIEEVVWVRILFIILFFSGGISILLYLVLWAIIPAAKTSADRLAMKGAPINISNIAKDVEESMEHLASKVTEFGENFKFKKKRKEDGGDSDNIIKQLVSVVVSIFSGIFKILVKIIKPFFYIICMVAMLGAVVAWLALIFGLYKAIPFSSFIVAGPSAISYMANGLIFLSLGIPLALIIAGLLKWVFKTAFPAHIRRGLWGVWGISLIILFSLSMWTIREFKTIATTGETFELGELTEETLNIDLESHYSNTFSGDQFGPLSFSDNQFRFPALKIRIVESPTESFSATLHKSARGMTLQKARALASGIDINSSIDANTLTISENIEVNKGSKWRNQEAELEIKVPHGKYIKLDGNRYNYDVEIDRNSLHPGKISGYTWKMTENGLICPEYITENSYQEERILDPFTSLILDGHMIVSVQKSEEYKVVLKAAKKLIDQLNISQINSNLSIAHDTDLHRNQVKVTVYTPTLQNLDLINPDEVSIEGFNESSMKIKVESHHDINAFMEVSDLTLDLSGRHEFKLKGIGGKLDLNLNNAARLNAGHFNVKDAVITGKNYRRSSINATETVTTDAPSRLNIVGNPKIISKEVAN